MQPSISVIIPTLNEEKYIPTILSNLENQTISPNEIFVVDGQSTDKTLKQVKHFKKIQIITSKATGTAKQRNLGANKAQSDWLLFFDADVEVDTKFIENSLQQIRSRNLDIACPRYWPNPSTFSLKIIFGVMNTLFWMGQKILPSGGGPCIFVKKSVWNSTKGFDPHYLHDDMQFIRKASRQRKFGIINTTCQVSSRRYLKEGSWKVFWKYCVLSFWFCLNMFEKANKVEYDMSGVRHESKPS